MTVGDILVGLAQFLIDCCDVTIGVQNQMAKDIDVVANQCVAIFKQVYDLLDMPNYSYTNNISSSEVRDQLGRFKIWGNNIGAFQPRTRRSSLEYRLRDASQTRQQVLRLLNDLQESLDESNCNPRPLLSANVIEKLSALFQANRFKTL